MNELKSGSEISGKQRKCLSLQSILLVDDPTSRKSSSLNYPEDIIISSISMTICYVYQVILLTVYFNITLPIECF